MLIGLTGGIGSGKSTVAGFWVGLGAKEVDADLLAREVVMPGTLGLAQVAEVFGSDLVLASGELDRQELANRAFKDSESRKKLEAILHPLIRQRAQEQVASATGHVVYTIPLLVESKSSLPFDQVVTVSCPEEVRVQRLLRRGLTEGDARARIASQASDADREAVADYVIDSNCSLEELKTRAEALFRKLVG